MVYKRCFYFFHNKGLRSQYNRTINKLFNFLFKSKFLCGKISNKYLLLYNVEMLLYQNGVIYNIL